MVTHIAGTLCRDILDPRCVTLALETIFVVEYALVESGGGLSNARETALRQR